MKGQIAHALEERMAPLTKRIENLEQRHSVEGVDAIAWQSAEEDDILRQLDRLAALAGQAGSIFSQKVTKKLQSLATRMELLPSFPRIEVVRLAQNILAQNPVMLVTDDAMNEKRQQLELMRIFLMESAEISCFDYQFPSFLHENEGSQSLEAVGKSDEINSRPVSLEQAWTELRSVLHGRFLVAFDFPLVQLQLAVTARRYGLPIPMLVGHSLLDLFLKYARVKEFIDDAWENGAPSFSDTQLGRVLAKEDVAPLNDSSTVSADQRARHLLHALQAIANGTLLQEPPLISPMM